MQELTSRGWRCKLALTVGKFGCAAKYLAQNPWHDTIEISNPTGTREGRIRALAKSLKEQGPDFLIVLNTPDAYVAASRLGPIRPQVVMALHGVEPQYYGDIENFGAVIDAVVVPSKLALKLVQKLTDFPNNRLFKIPAGVKCDNWGFEVPNNPIEIVYAGRLAREAKRVQDIPGIFRELDRLSFDYRFLIAGEGEERQFLESELAENQGEVEFLGLLSHEELVQEVFQPGRVLLITSERETGPLVAWEAMSRGVLVVTSNYRGLTAEQTLIDGLNALVFPVGDTRTAASQLCRAGNVRIYRRLVENAKNSVKTKYLLERTVRDWIELFDGIEVRDCVVNESSSLPRFSRDGRLSKLLGIEVAETTRQLLGLSYRHESAGGEWPHSYGSRHPSELYHQAVEQVEGARPI